MSTSTDATPPSKPGSPAILGRWRWVALVVLFALGFTAARTAVNQVWEWQFLGTATDKLAAFESAGVDYTTLFIGSSRVFRQVSPEVIDARFAEAGIESRSFNVGVPGMTALEMLEVLERALDAAPDSLHTVVVGPERIVHALPDANVTSTRVIAGHSLGATARAMEALLDQDLPLRVKLDYGYNHLAALAWNLTGLGQALTSLGRPPHPDDPESVGPAGDGYLPLDAWYEIGSPPTVRRLERRKERFEELGRDGFARSVNDLLAQAVAAQAAPPPLTGYEESLLRDLRSMVEDRGLRLVFMVPTGGFDYRADWLLAGVESGLVEHLIDMADPQVYPDLFVYDLWYDETHLNTLGAAQFSRHVADRLITISGGEPPEETAHRALTVAERAVVSTGVVHQDGTLVKAQRDAFVALPDVTPGTSGVVALTINEETARAGGVLEERVDGAWVEVIPETTVRGGDAIVFWVDGLDPAADAVRVRLVGRAGMTIDRVAVVTVPVPAVEWLPSGLERDGDGFTKTDRDGWLDPITGGSTAYAVQFTADTARPGIRLDTVLADGTVIEGAESRADDDGWAIAYAPFVAEGVSLRLTVLGGRGTGITQILGTR